MTVNIVSREDFYPLAAAVVEQNLLVRKSLRGRQQVDPQLVMPLVPPD